MGNFPVKDVHILVSYLNTMLRDDKDCTFDDLCYSSGMSREELEAFLMTGGYQYSEELRKIR